MLKSQMRETFKKILEEHGNEDKDLLDDLVDAMVVEAADEVYDDEDEDEDGMLGED